MGMYNQSCYRGFEIQTVVISCLPPNGGFSGTVSVSLNGEIVGVDSTEVNSHFLFAEDKARKLGEFIVDQLLGNPQSRDAET